MIGERKDFTMSTKSHICQSCFLICEEAKENVKKLQKKLYAMTIVCTVSITLLGEQGAKALMASVNTVNSAMSAVEDKKDSKEETLQEENKKNEKHTWNPIRPFLIPNYIDKSFVKKYEIIDELTRLPKKEDPEIPVNIVEAKIPNKILVSLTKDSVFEPLPPMDVVNTSTQFLDNYSVFFSPSLLPFDVYSNTLALGNNYGFGEYYGIDTGYFISTPTPGPVVLTGFAMLMFAPTRQRN